MLTRNENWECAWRWTNSATRHQVAPDVVGEKATVRRTTVWPAGRPQKQLTWQPQPIVGCRPRSVCYVAPMRIPLLAMTLVVASVAACDKRPTHTREWVVADHDQPPSPNQVAPPAETPTPSAAAAGAAGISANSVNQALAHRGLSEQILQVWVERCATCHGTIGRGDGPQSRLVNVRDLSDPAWQQATSDAQIEMSISKGRGMMPAFALPEETLKGLANLVRLFAQRSASPPDSGTSK